MTDLKTLNSDARPQAVSPLFTRLPLELRLLIYKFVFVGCQAKVYLEMKFRGDAFVDTWGKIRRWAEYQWDQCCYEHFGGGFGLLATCRMIYIEASQAYWSEVVLTVMCGSPHKVYICLPAMIKANLRHLRNLNLTTTIWGKWPTRDDPDWIPRLLSEFPKLVSCQFRHLADHLLRVRDLENPSNFYHGVGRFNLKSGESLPAYLERTMGIKPSCGVIILSKATCDQFDDRLESDKCCVSPIHVYVPHMK